MPECRWKNKSTWAAAYAKLSILLESLALGIPLFPGPSTVFTNLCFRASCFTLYAAAAAAKSLQYCPTVRPHRRQTTRLPLSQARTLEWVAISFSNAWKWKVKVKLLSPVRLSVTPWTAAYQAPPSMGFSRQEYWSSIVQILITLKLTYLVLFFSFNVLLILSNSRHPQIIIIIFSTSFHWLLFLLATFDNRISRSY